MLLTMSEKFNKIKNFSIFESVIEPIKLAQSL